MKILFVVNGYPDGLGSQAHIFTHNQAVALKNAGMDVAVMFIDLRSIRRKRPLGITKYELENVPVYRCAFPCGPIKPLLLILRGIARNLLFQKIKKDFGIPDILHGHFSDSAFTAMKLGKKYDIPYVVTEHGSAVLSRRLSKVDSKKASLAYNNAESVIAVGSALQKVVKSMTTNEVKLIPNIIPDYYFENSDNIVKEREFFSYISVGGLIYRKRMDMTISAFAEVSKAHDDVKLVIVGQGPLKTNLIHLTEQLDIKDRVSFLGVIQNKDLPSIYKACDCFVLPSEFETFGVVYAEAMACGLPVIATRCGGPEDFVSDSCGIMIDCGNKEQLICAMERMYSDSHKYDPMAISIRMYDKLSSIIIVEKILDVYKEVLKRNQ